MPFAEATLLIELLCPITIPMSAFRRAPKSDKESPIMMLKPSELLLQFLEYPKLVLCTEDASANHDVDVMS